MLTNPHKTHHRRQAHAIHLRSRIPHCGGPKPAPQHIEPARSTSLGTQPHTPRDRAGRRTVTAHGTPHDMPHHVRPRRRDNDTSRGNQPAAAVEAAAEAQTAHDVGEVRAQEGHRQVRGQREGRGGAGGAAQEPGV